MTADVQAELRALADDLPMFVWTQSFDGSIEWANRCWLEYVRLPRGLATSAEGWAQAVHPDDVRAAREAFRRALEERTTFAMQLRIKPADGDAAAYRRFAVRGAPWSLDGHTPRRWMFTGVDVDSEHGARTREEFFSQLGAELAGALSLEQTLRVVTQRIVPEFADWALVNLIDDHGDVRLAAAYHRDEAMRRVLDEMRGAAYINQDAQSGTAQVVRLGAPLVYESVAGGVLDDAVRDEFRETFVRIGLDSVLLVPLFSGGRVVGTLNALMRASGRTFSGTDVPFFEEIGRRITPAIGNATAYERERRVATTFQQAALVPSLPHVPGLTFDAMYQAAMLEATVGGDWYDAFRLPDGRVVLSIGDVAGKGLDAAVAMASVRQSIRTAALINPEPMAVLNAVDRIVRAMGQAPFVTAFVGVLDPVTFELTFASAGHPPALLRAPDGSVSALPEGDLPLGMRLRALATSETIEIAPGSVLLCYTDGLTEFDRDPIAGEAKVADALRHATAEIARKIYGTVALGRPAQDDVALLAVSFDRPLTEIEGPLRASRWTFEASDGEAAGRARGELVARLRAVGLGAEQLASAELVFGELVGNVVRYAPGRVVAILDVAGESPVLHVIDEGRGFEFRPRLPVDLMSERGRGLFLVTAFAEEVSVQRRRAGGSHARAVLL